MIRWRVVAVETLVHKQRKWLGLSNQRQVIACFRVWAPERAPASKMIDMGWCDEGAERGEAAVEGLWKVGEVRADRVMLRVLLGGCFV